MWAVHGQAVGARVVLRQGGPRLQRGRWRAGLHLVADLLLGAVLLGLLGAGVLAWRLGQGAMDVTWAARRLTRLVSQPDATLRVGRATLAWNGYRDGVGGSLQVELEAVSEVATDGSVIAAAPRAALSLPLWPILLGRFEPSAIRLDAPSVTVARLADGGVQLVPGSARPGSPGSPESPGPPGRLLDALRGPGHGALSRLRRVEVHNLALLVHDAALGVDWRVGGEIDLKRLDGNRVLGRADLRAGLGATSVALAVRAELLADGSGTALSLTASPFSPAALASEAPALRDGPGGMLAGLDAPVSAAMTARLGPELGLVEGEATLGIGTGRVSLGEGMAPLSGGTLLASATPAQVSLKRLELAFAPLQPGAAGMRLTASGRLRQAASGTTGQAVIDLDRADFAELGRYWPRGLGGGARGWITTNIVAGQAHGLHVEAGLAGPGSEFRGVSVTSLTGGFDAEGVTGYWLRPLPPITGGRLRLDLDGPDAVVVRLAEGQEEALSVAGGVIRISGLGQADQLADITAPIHGPLAGVLRLLAQPRLALLQRAKVDLSEAAGQFDGTLHVQLPLESKVTFDSIRVAATAKVAQARFPAIVAGRDFDQAALSATISNDGLGITGSGRLAGLPTTLSVAMDFRAGPRVGVATTVQAHATATPAELAALGLDAGTHVAGMTGLQARYDERRDGRADIVLDADLARTALSLPLDLSKPAGGAASLHAHVLLDQGRLVGLDELRADGPGLVLRSSAEVVDGAPRVLRLQQIVIGRTVGTGVLTMPARPGTAIRLSLAGATLDLSALFPSGTPAPRPLPTPRVADKAAVKTAGQAWQVDARFDQVLLAARQPIAPFVAHAENDGLRLTALRVDAGGAAAITAQLGQDGRGGAPGRTLALKAADAGVLLRSVDVADNIRGGQLSLQGRFDDSRPDAPLQATARMSSFRVTDAPMVARLLKAATLFGLADVLRGPGVSFSRLVLPFRYAGGMLDIGPGRAVSPTLGITATGRLDLAGDAADLRGTVVPAYLLNTALGRLPLVGTLFSPEKGGGVFAAEFSIRGPFAAPVVGVNPLSVLAPGALRRLFWLPEEATK